MLSPRSLPTTPHYGSAVARADALEQPGEPAESAAVLARRASSPRAAGTGGALLAQPSRSALDHRERQHELQLNFKIRLERRVERRATSPTTPSPVSPLASGASSTAPTPQPLAHTLFPDDFTALEQCTATELKEMLRVRGLPTTGRKAILLERLMASPSGQRVTPLQLALSPSAEAGTSVGSSPTGSPRPTGSIAAAGGRGIISPRYAPYGASPRGQAQHSFEPGPAQQQTQQPFPSLTDAYTASLPAPSRLPLSGRGGAPSMPFPSPLQLAIVESAHSSSTGSSAHESPIAPSARPPWGFAAPPGTSPLPGWAPVSDPYSHLQPPPPPPLQMLVLPYDPQQYAQYQQQYPQYRQQYPDQPYAQQYHPEQPFPEQPYPERPYMVEQYTHCYPYQQPPYPTDAFALLHPHHQQVLYAHAPPAPYPYPAVQRHFAAEQLPAHASNSLPASPRAYPPETAPAVVKARSPVYRKSSSLDSVLRPPVARHGTLRASLSDLSAGTTLVEHEPEPEAAAGDDVSAEIDNTREYAFSAPGHLTEMVNTREYASEVAHDIDTAAQNAAATERWVDANVVFEASAYAQPTSHTDHTVSADQMDNTIYIAPVSSPPPSGGSGSGVNVWANDDPLSL